MAMNGAVIATNDIQVIRPSCSVNAADPGVAVRMIRASTKFTTALPASVAASNQVEVNNRRIR